MAHAPASTPLILVNVVLLGHDRTEEVYDAEQLMYCNALPRVGERLVPQSGELGEVVRIEHRAVKVGPQLEHPVLLPIVVLRPVVGDPPSE